MEQEPTNRLFNFYFFGSQYPHMAEPWWGSMEPARDIKDNCFPPAVGTKINLYYILLSSSAKTPLGSELSYLISPKIID